MKTGTLVETYLRDLEKAAADLPADARAELVAQVREHLDAATDDLDPDDEVGLRAALDRLGEPSDIVVEWHESGAVVATTSPRVGRPAKTYDFAAIGLLLGGGLLLGVGWLVGLVMLWFGPRWTLRDKLLGTLIWPGGLVTPFVATYLVSAMLPFCVFSDGAISTTCGPSPDTVPWWITAPTGAIVLGLPILVALRLARRAAARRGSGVGMPAARQG